MFFFSHKKIKKNYDDNMYNWEDEMLHSASRALEVVAATAASPSGAAAVAAACEAGEPAAPLVGVGPRVVVIAAAIPSAGVQPSPAPDVPRG
jgi:hypothetical protein